MHGLSVSSPPSGARERANTTDVEIPVLASDEELLRGKRFDALEPEEPVQLYRLMTRLRIATPRRRTRRARRDRHGERVDLRRTLRGSRVRRIVTGRDGRHVSDERRW